MSVMYTTAAELASFLKQDLDTSTATLAIQTASQLFSTRAATMFAVTTETYQVEGCGARRLELPFRPVVGVSAVRIVTGAGITTTLTVGVDYSRIKRVLYRSAGWGSTGAFPPDMVEVDLSHGYASAGDDVKGAVLETAATAYQSPDPSTVSESIDDYSIRTAPNIGGMMLTPAAEKLADLYRGTLAA